MSDPSQSVAPEFSRWRSRLWPIHGHELKKLLPMLAIFFFISFNYNVLRTLKDSLLVTAKSSGAEVIPFVKVWAMFPGAIAVTWLYTWMSHHFSQEKVFYSIICGFLALFFVFTFVLYPLGDFIHPHQLADYLETVLPLGMKGLVAMIRYWSFSLFYVASELWGSLVLMVLFWGFANQVTKLGEAKRFYGLFGVGANVSGVFAGQASVYCCQYPEWSPLAWVGVGVGDPWFQSFGWIMLLILASGALALATFYALQRGKIGEESPYTSPQEALKNSNPPKPSFKQSISILFSSPYLLCLALIVLGYNLVINLTEVIWKHQVRELYPDPQAYTLYMNQIVSIIGGVATLSSLFFSGNAVRKWGWTGAALVTPLILLVTSVGFFGAFFLKSPYVGGVLSGAVSLSLVVFLGSMQNVLSRGAKYSLFDATKEMAFVPLGKESKVIGKAVIDGICSRLGKSGGSLIYQVLLLFCSTVGASAPYVAGALFIVIGAWTVAVWLLGRQFDALADPSSGEEEHAARERPLFAFPTKLQEQAG